MIFNFDKLNLNNIALINPLSDKIVYYKDLKEKCELIRKKNLGKNLVLIYSENTEGFIASYISFIQNNHCVMLCGNSIDQRDLKLLIKNYRPNIVCFPKKLRAQFVKKKFDKLNEFFDYNIYFAKKKKIYKIYKKLSLMLSTSGSTGNKKWVKLSEDNLKSNISAVSSYFKINDKNITITSLPPEYTYGLSIINTHIYSGAKIILNNFSVIEKEFWQLINKYKVESFGGVPFTYALLKKIKFQNLIKNNKLKYLTQAGGKLSDDIHRYIVKVLLKKKNKILCNVWSS